MEKKIIEMRLWAETWLEWEKQKSETNQKGLALKWEKWKPRWGKDYLWKLSVALIILRNQTKKEEEWEETETMRVLREKKKASLFLEMIDWGFRGERLNIYLWIINFYYKKIDVIN